MQCFCEAVLAVLSSQRNTASLKEERFCAPNFNSILLKETGYPSLKKRISVRISWSLGNFSDYF